MPLARYLTLFSLHVAAVGLTLSADGGPVAAAQAPGRARVHAAEVEESARALEKRLLAPCCYKQTVDAHDSELTSALRREIRQRLSGGESAHAIEQALVARHGARVLAVPPASPLETVALVSLLTVFAAGGVLWWRAGRWVRNEADLVAEAPSDPSDAPYDAAIDEALRRLERR